jgi:hypothetical protein
MAPTISLCSTSLANSINIRLHRPGKWEAHITQSSQQWSDEVVVCCPIRNSELMFHHQFKQKFVIFSYDFSVLTEQSYRPRLCAWIGISGFTTSTQGTQFTTETLQGESNKQCVYLNHEMKNCETLKADLLQAIKTLKQHEVNGTGSKHSK